jgi:hypothetical protein
MNTSFSLEKDPVDKKWNFFCHFLIVEKIHYVPGGAELMTFFQVSLKILSR